MHSTRNGTSLAVSDLKRDPGQSYPCLPRLSDGWIRFQAENTVSQVPRKHLIRLDKLTVVRCLYESRDIIVLQQLLRAFCTKTPVIVK